MRKTVPSLTGRQMETCRVICTMTDTTESLIFTGTEKPARDMHFCGNHVPGTLGNRYGLTCLSLKKNTPKAEIQGSLPELRYPKFIISNAVKNDGESDVVNHNFTSFFVAGQRSFLLTSGKRGDGYHNGCMSGIGFLLL